MTLSFGKIEKKIVQQGETLRNDVKLLGENLQQQILHDIGTLKEEAAATSAKWEAAHASLENRLLQVKDHISQRPPAPSNNASDKQFRLLKARLDRLEQQDRRERAKNISIRGLGWEEGEDLAAAAEFLVTYFGIEHGIQSTNVTGRNLDCIIVKLKTIDMKRHILRNKHCLRGTGYYVDGDQTVIQSEAQKKIRDIRTKLKAEGHDVRVAFDKLYIDNVKYIWNYNTEELEPVQETQNATSTEHPSPDPVSEILASSPNPRETHRGSPKNHLAANSGRTT